jgi:hypothetical protein
VSVNHFAKAQKQAAIISSKKLDKIARVHSGSYTKAITIHPGRWLLRLERNIKKNIPTQNT